MTTSLAELPAKDGPLQLLSNTAITSGEARDRAARMAALGDAAEVELAGEAEPAAKAFVDEVIERLDSKLDSSGGRGGTDGAYRISLQDDGITLHTTAGDTQMDPLAELIKQLIADHDLLEAISLPYVPGNEQATRALLNDEPVHPNGKEMHQAKELASGHYLEVNLSAEQKMRYGQEVAETVGLDCQFDGE